MQQNQNYYNQQTQYFKEPEYKVRATWGLAWGLLWRMWLICLVPYAIIFVIASVVSGL